MTRVRRPNKWIQKALGKRTKRGALHRQLGIPVGKRIPITVLRRAAKARGTLGRRARFALVLRKIGKRSHRATRRRSTR